jgi:hypothetical protein
MVFTLIGDSTMNNLVWVFFSMAGFSTPTPCQCVLFSRPQTPAAIEKKKNLTSRARVRGTCAREKLHYEISYSSIPCELSCDMLKKKILIPVVSLLCLGMTACGSGTSDSSRFVAGADLSGENLSGQDLSGLNLAGANMTGADLSNVKLDNTDLRGANLTTANLTMASLVGADLSGANITGTVLEGADFTDTTLTGIQLGDTSLVGLKGVPTTTVPPTTSTTIQQQESSDDYESPDTTSKPVYIVRTEVRTISKSLPNGPWRCQRTFVYSDGKRTNETFTSQTECSQ